MDPLSDVLALLKVTGHVSGGLDAAGTWSVGFGASGGIKFHAILSGACWLAVDGVAEPVRLEASTCAILAHGRPFRVATDLSLPPVDGLILAQTAGPGGIVTYNGGGDFHSVGGYFQLSETSAHLLLDWLPPVLLLTGETDQTLVRWCIDRLRHEVRGDEPGRALVAQQLAMMMLVQALRSLPPSQVGPSGWLYALAEPHLRRALVAMHRDPARRWTLADLASAAAMSRTVFAVRFRQVVGMTPLEYLTRWRMSLAADRLANTGDGVAEISTAVGYDSDKSFSTAFRRIRHISPREFRGTNRREARRA